MKWNPFAKAKKAAQTVSKTRVANAAPPPVGNVTQQKLIDRGMRLQRVTAAVLAHKKLTPAQVRLGVPSIEPRYISIPVTPRDYAKFPDLLRLERELTNAARLPVSVSATESGLFYQFSLPSALHGRYRFAEMPPGVIGFGPNKTGISVEPTPSAPHLLVGGASGCGKSTTHAGYLLIRLKRNTPRQLKLVVIDLKGDAMFSPFSRVSHLACPVVTDLDTLDRTMVFVKDEYNRRLRVPPQHKANLPWFELAIDEAAMIPPDAEYWQTLVEISKIGRGIKMQLSIGTQDLTAIKQDSNPLRVVRKNVAHKMVGRVDNPNESYDLTGVGGLYANKLTGKGDFLYLAAGDEAIRLLVAEPDLNDFDDLPRLPAPPPLPKSDSGDLVDVRPEDVLAPDEPEESTPGRNPVEVTPELAWEYIKHGHYKKSYRQAQAAGFGRTTHSLVKPWVTEFLELARKDKRL
jgi:hypothetical protein